MATGYTAVSATNLCDATGTVITNATISFEPVDNKGNSISFRAGGTSEGQASSQPVSTTVTNGAFTIQLADTTLTEPKNVGYTVTVIDNVTGDCLLGPDGYICVQPSGATWSFDTYQPNFAAQITVQYGPQGLSAYQVYQSEGGTLDEADWLASLHGATGAPGASGIVGIPIYATPSAGSTAGTGAAVGGYYLVPSTTPGQAFDIYQNVANAPVLYGELASQNVLEKADGLYVIDGAGWYVKLFDYATGTFTPIEGRIETLESEVATLNATCVKPDGLPDLFLEDSVGFQVGILQGGKSPLFDPMYLLPATIARLNATCVSYSDGVRGSYDPDLTTIVSQLVTMFSYGQSLSTGYQTVVARSITAMFGNLMLGDRPGFDGNNGSPLNNANLNPLIEVSTNITGETGCAGLCNFAKLLLNIHERETNDTSLAFVSNALGQPGFGLGGLLPSSATATNTPGPGGVASNVWNRVLVACADTMAAAAGRTVQAGGTFYLQGEADVGLDNTAWIANMLTLRAAFDAEYAASFGQTSQAGFYTYQTQDGSLAPAGKSIPDAQWMLAKTQPNWYLYSPHYHMPSFGLHLIADSYRWLACHAAKVWFRTAILRQGWLPTGPHKCEIVGNTLLVGFHTPVGALTVQPCYPPIFASDNVTITGSATTILPDYGFKLYDAKGAIAITVAIVAAQVVQITPSRIVDWTTAYLRYAGGDSNTVGNIADSDPMVATGQLYAAAPNPDNAATGSTSTFDIPALVGKPYPLYNMSVAFCIAPSSFNNTVNA